MAEDDKFAHHAHLRAVAEEDVRYVLEKDRSYGASWKRRGGVGAFMMLARKWDRLEEMVTRGRTAMGQYDIFAAVAADDVAVDGRRIQGADGTVLAEVRDLRRYLLLVEAEMIARGAVAAPAAPEEDLYSLAAKQWACTRPKAKKRLLEHVYGAERLVPRAVALYESGALGADGQCMWPGGVVGEFMPDGDVDVTWEDGERGQTKWSQCVLAEPAARPGTPEDGGHHEPRRLPLRLDADAYQKLSAEDRELYFFSPSQRAWIMRQAHAEERGVAPC